MAESIKSVEERVIELLTTAPPMTAEQRELAVRMLAMPAQSAARRETQQAKVPGRAA